MVAEAASTATLVVMQLPTVAVDYVLPLRIRATGKWKGHSVVAETTLTVVRSSKELRKVAMP